MTTITQEDQKDRTHPIGVAAFKHYYVGINSLDELATKEDRVCVLNILGGESRTVTPTSHVFSGGEHRLWHHARPLRLQHENGVGRYPGLQQRGGGH